MGSHESIHPPTRPACMHTSLSFFSSLHFLFAAVWGFRMFINFLISPPYSLGVPHIMGCPLIWKSSAYPNNEFVILPNSISRFLHTVLFTFVFSPRFIPLETSAPTQG